MATPLCETTREIKITSWRQRWDVITRRLRGLTFWRCYRFILAWPLRSDCFHIATTHRGLASDPGRMLIGACSRYNIDNARASQCSAAVWYFINGRKITDPEKVSWKLAYESRECGRTHYCTAPWLRLRNMSTVGLRFCTNCDVTDL